jgi:Acyl-CoA dehydrogenase, C-terminal domain
MTMDAAERGLLAETFRATMTASSGRDLDSALTELGWPELLAQWPDVAIPMTFRLLGETGAHAPLINDVLLHAAGRPTGGTVPLPSAGGRWVLWGRASPREDDPPGTLLDDELPLHEVPAGEQLPLAAGRRALGWWLTGTGRAMLSLARSHAVDRVQFGRRIASFQAVRHRLAETLVALEGAEATLLAAEDDLGSLLAKAAAGQAALVAARHCQQVLGGIGFTAEHGLHRHVRRALVLDGLLGSAVELTREAGAILRAHRSAPRLVHL